MSLQTSQSNTNYIEFKEKGSEFEVGESSSSMDDDDEGPFTKIRGNI